MKNGETATEILRESTFFSFLGFLSIPSIVRRRKGIKGFQTYHRVQLVVLYQPGSLAFEYVTLL